MGHTADVSGEIRIVPPIPWGEIKDSPFLAGRHHRLDLRFELDQTREDTPDGYLVRTLAVAIVCGGDERRGGDILEELQAIATTHGQGRTFEGRLDVRWPDFEGSEKRYKIVGGHATEYAPTVLWPTESE